LEIIIRNKNKIKGRSVSEFARNLESNGWPSEFAREEVRDRVKYFEKRENRPVNKGDLNQITREIGG